MSPFAGRPVELNAFDSHTDSTRGNTIQRMMKSQAKHTQREEKMKRKLLITSLMALITAPPIPAIGQVDCAVCAPAPVVAPCVQEYKLVCQTIYEEKPITTRRLQTETIVEQRQVVRYRPTWETTMKERRYTVSKPVMQTSMREERKTVMKPVWEVRYKDMSYDRVRYVTQTSSRTERRVVQKPIYETTMRQEQRVVQKPVTTTVMQDQVATAYKPVTSYYQRTVDQGGFVDQYQYQPGDVRHRLRWQKAQCKTDPVTGQCAGVQRAGLYWQPKEAPGKYTVAKAYVPNPVTQQLAQTQYVPQQVTRKVPVAVTQMQSEVQVRQVPVQTVRMQQEEQVREVPVTVQRPVTERVKQFKPEYRCRMVPQEYVRQVPVNTYKFVTEERVEQIPVRTCKMVKEYRKIEVPRTQSRWVEEVTMRRIPRTVYMKVPIESGVVTSSPVEYNHRIISDSPVVNESYVTDEFGAAFTESTESYPIAPPIVDPLVEPTAGNEDASVSSQEADDQPTLQPIPKGNRPTIEGSWRSVRKAERVQPKATKTAGRLFRLSSN